jgi:hypothetical protein
MFDDDLDELTTTDLLAVAAEYAQDQERAAVGILRAALAFADRNAVVEGYEPLPGYERFVVYGGDGCPGVAEFAPVEFGAVLGMSSGAAAALIGEALALRHRLPRVWAAVLAGNAVSWRARKIAHACLSLSLEAAAIVDRRVAGIVNTVTPRKLAAITTAAMWEADPEQAQAEAEAAAQARGVFVAESDDHGTKRIWIRAAAGAVIRFDATIDDLARALAALGDTDTLDQRRAKAIDWIADPAAAHQLIEVARHLARTQPTRTSTTALPVEETDPATASADTGSADRASADAASADRASADRASADRARSDTASADTASADTACADIPRGNGAGRDIPAGSVRRDSALHARDAQQNPPADGPAATAPTAPTSQGCDVTDDVVNGDLVNGEAAGEDGFTRRALAGKLPARLAAIKRDAYSSGLGAGSSRRSRHTVYVHLTDKTLATGNGVLRVEELGPLLARQVGELLGHDQVVVKPVIDLHDQVSVHSYEIPDRIRERVRLRHPVDMFPYGGAEATVSMDQDHIRPYDHASRRAGPPDLAGPPDRAGQTSVDNLIPQSRLHHRAKTFGGWTNRRLPTGGIEWISPHGFRFVVDHTGTHPLSSTPTRS